MTNPDIIMECKQCGRRYTNPQGHICINGCGYTLTAIDNQRTRHIPVKVDRRMDSKKDLMRFSPCKKDGVPCTKRHKGCSAACPDWAMFESRKEEKRRAQAAEAYTSLKYVRSHLRKLGRTERYLNHKGNMTERKEHLK